MLGNIMVKNEIERVVWERKRFGASLITFVQKRIRQNVRVWINTDISGNLSAQFETTLVIPTGTGANFEYASGRVNVPGQQLCKSVRRIVRIVTHQQIPDGTRPLLVERPLFRHRTNPVTTVCSIAEQNSSSVSRL